jgi:hypothetical protein
MNINPSGGWSQLAEHLQRHLDCGVSTDYGTRTYKDRQAELDAMGFDLQRPVREEDGREAVNMALRTG